MPDIERQTRSHLMRLFKRHGFHPRFHLGQNFLIDLNLIEFIIREAELTEDDVLLEIGAGTGSLTAYLARDGGHVVSVEVDGNMHQLASEAVRSFDHVTLLNRDALKRKSRFADEVIEAVERELAVNPRRRLKLVANLPYSIATPVMANLVASDWNWERMIVTIQYEMAQRMQAAPGSKSYGALSVWLQSQCRVEILNKLPPSVFWPRPKVDSAIVKVTPDPDARARIADREFFHHFIRSVFQHRRKHLRSVLAGMFREGAAKEILEATLTAMNLPVGTRAEELSVAEHVELANRLFQNFQSHSPLPDATEGGF